MKTFTTYLLIVNLFTFSIFSASAFEGTCPNTDSLEVMPEEKTATFSSISSNIYSCHSKVVSFFDSSSRNQCLEKGLEGLNSLLSEMPGELYDLAIEGSRFAYSLNPTTRFIMKMLDIKTTDEILGEYTKTLVPIIQENETQILRYTGDSAYREVINEKAKNILKEAFAELGENLNEASCSELIDVVCPIIGGMSPDILLSLVLAAITIASGGTTSAITVPKILLTLKRLNKLVPGLGDKVAKIVHRQLTPKTKKSLEVQKGPDVSDQIDLIEDKPTVSGKKRASQDVVHDKPNDTDVKKDDGDITDSDNDPDAKKGAPKGNINNLGISSLAKKQLLQFGQNARSILRKYINPDILDPILNKSLDPKKVKALSPRQKVGKIIGVCLKNLRSDKKGFHTSIKQYGKKAKLLCEKLLPKKLFDVDYENCIWAGIKGTACVKAREYYEQFQFGGNSFGNIHNDSSKWAFPNINKNNGATSVKSNYVELDLGTDIIDGSYISKGRGKERLVFDKTTGDAWVTNDHYQKGIYVGCLKDVGSKPCTSVDILKKMCAGKTPRGVGTHNCTVQPQNIVL